VLSVFSAILTYIRGR